MKSTPEQGQTCTFQVLFTSDVHGAFRDYNYALDKETSASGISKIATLMREEKKKFEGQTFIVDVGDIIQGNGTSPLVKLDKFGKDYQPFPLLAAYDAIGYDIVSIGNHEFNFGIPALMNAFTGFKGEKLCGNVFTSGKTLLDGFKAYTIKTLGNGLRVAFVGVVSPNVEVWDRVNLAGYSSVNAAEATQHIISHIKSRDLADIIILLGHMHIDNELNRAGSGARDVVMMNPEIDVFLGAHFHQRIGTKDNQHTLLGTVKFAENLDSAKSFGRVKVTATFESGKWHVKKPVGDYNESDVKTDIITIRNGQTVENDEAVVKATKKAHRFIQEYLRETVVGKLSGGSLVPEPEIKGTNEAVLRPTPLIHLISTIMRKYAGTDIASASLNNYDANCPEGVITLGSIIRMFVYDNNKVYKLAMTGRQIKQWMEWSYAFFGTPVDGKPELKNPAVNPETDLTIPYGTRKVYLHDKFAGLSYEVDLTKPVGARIYIIRMADGSEFDETKTYTVATTNYRAATTLTMHADEGVFPDPSEPLATVLEMDVHSPQGNINVLDWIREYISSQPEKTIRNDVEENWCFVNLRWDEELRRKAIDLINSGELNYDFTKPVKKENINE